MHVTQRNKQQVSDRIAVDTLTLAEMLGCGRGSAVKIGIQANARISIGKRVLWNVERVKDFVNTFSEESVAENGEEG